MTDQSDYLLLESVNSPEDLRQLEVPDLIRLAEELRQFLITSVAKTGGHLASSLGTIEIAIALHYVYNTPEDKIIWDVGHQAYAHKILTGRRQGMSQLRKSGGISGFPKRSESPYDAFGTGHSSTSIGAALGMAVANARKNNHRKAVAVIGDGAMTAGMAFEALNHAGDMEADILVVLNDNDMSISNNVGALSNHLARILSGKLYSTVRESGKKVLKGLPPVWELARKAEEHMKGMVVPGTLFEELGFNYIGPVDGHDLPTLVKTLSNLQELRGPQFLHIATRKGYGYKPAEDNPSAYHGVGKFDPEVGKQEPANAEKTYTGVFSDWLCDMAATDEKLMGITPAMCEGSGLVEFSTQFPDQYFDVGIAEQHAITFAAGLACEDYHPVVAIYSSFLQRGYDQLIHDVALQKLSVLFAIDRGGLVGADGATHDGIFDMAYLRCIPEMVIMAPSDEAECRCMLTTGHKHPGPAAVRYPRGSGPGAKPSRALETVDIGKSNLRREGSRVAILSFGSLLPEALKAADELNATVVDMRFVKPLDADVVEKMASTHQLIVTLEEGVLMGGAGSAVNEAIAVAGQSPGIINLGLPDSFNAHGNRENILADFGLDSAGIQKAVKSCLEPLGQNQKCS